MFRVRRMVAFLPRNSHSLPRITDFPAISDDSL